MGRLSEAVTSRYAISLTRMSPAGMDPGITYSPAPVLMNEMSAILGPFGRSSRISSDDDGFLDPTDSVIWDAPLTSTSLSASTRRGARDITAWYPFTS